MVDEDDPEFTNGDVESIESLIYTDNAMPSYPNSEWKCEIAKFVSFQKDICC